MYETIKENMKQAAKENDRIKYLLRDEDAIDWANRITKNHEEVIKFYNSAKINYAKKSEVERMVKQSQVFVNRLKRIK